ncbi:MAG: hypothetical protein JSR44_04935 [Spirochaetes bacterium]|nr:hypothetical protein [Spirochaetota bacterium]
MYSSKSPASGSHFAVAASMPAGLWYLRSHYAETVYLPGFLFMMLMYLAGTAFMALYVFATQVSFPDTIPRAIFTLCVLATNAFTGFTMADFDIFYGAFSVAVTSLIAICIYIGYYLAVYGKQAPRSELFFRMQDNSVFPFFLILLICPGLILWAFSGAVIAELAEPKSISLKVIYIAAFTADIILTTRQYIFCNLLLKSEQTSKLGDIVEENVIPISIALVLGIFACLPIVANFSSAKQ